jgi:hypothetical protein
MHFLYVEVRREQHPLGNRDDEEIKDGDLTAAGWYVKFIGGEVKSRFKRVVRVPGEIW